MAELLPEIRNTTRALIIQQDRILLLRKDGGGRGERFALPGGAQDTGESLTEALNRECIEEIGTTVEIGDLIHVADFFKMKDRLPPSREHQIEFLFQCIIAADYTPHNGTHPDKHQVEVVWAEINKLTQLALFPQYLTGVISDHVDSDKNVYLGSFHDNAAP
mgnify:FL=1